MADFDVNTITVQGAIAIASATAGDKLVIDGCDATTDVFTQAQAVQISTRPASPASTTDTIGLAGSTDNHVYAYASFIRGESTGGDVHSFLLYGHKESDATTVFVVAVASAAAATHIPTSSDVTNRVEIQFELTFSATDEVVTVTDTSMYTTRGEFLILKNRTVTTHAEGQATVGEDQTVYGKKEFMDDMIFNGMYQVKAKTVEGQNTLNMFMFTQSGGQQTYGPAITAMTTYNGTTYVSSTASIGATSMLGIAGGASFSAEHNDVGDSKAEMKATRGLNGAHAGVVVEPTQVTLYTQSAGSNARRTLSYIGGQLTGSFSTIGTSNGELSVYVRASNADIDMYFDATSPDSTWSVSLTNAFDDKTARLQFYAGADSGGQLTCEPATGGTSMLGTGLTPWGEANVEVAYIHDVIFSSSRQEDGRALIDDTGVCTDNLNPYNNTTINANGSLMPGSNGLSLGSSVKQWNDVYASGIASLRDIQTDIIRKRGGTGNIGLWANLVPNTTDPVSLGSTSFSFSDVYANEFHGKLPAPTSSDSSNPPIGTIFLACIERDSSSSSYVLNAGVSLRPGYDPTCIGIYYASIISLSSVTGGHSIAYGKGAALPTYTNNPSVSGVYRTLSMADFNTFLFAYVLVMRIE